METFIYRGHSSIGVKSNIIVPDTKNIMLTQYKELTTFILLYGYNFITIHRYSCPIFANTTEYFLLWGLQSKTMKDKLLQLLQIKDGESRQKAKNELKKKMVENFLTKILSDNKTNNMVEFKSALIKYLSLDTVNLIWTTRHKSLLVKKITMAPKSVNAWTDQKRKEQFNKAVHQKYITPSILEAVDKDLNFTINIYKPGDSVPILCLDNKLIFNYPEIRKRNIYYYGFFPLPKYLNKSEPLVTTISIPTQTEQDLERLDVQLKGVHADINRLRIVSKEYDILLKKESAIKVQIETINQEKDKEEKVGLSEYNIINKIPTEMKLEPYVSAFIKIYEIIKTKKSRKDLNLVSKYRAISNKIITLEEFNIIGDILFKLDIKDIDKVLKVLNNDVAIIQKFKIIGVLTNITPDTLYDNLAKLSINFKYTFEGNFFKLMPPSNYIFASCGSLTKDTQKLYDKLKPDDQINLNEEMLTSQQKSYKRKYN